MVGGDAIGEGVWAAGILGNVSTKGAGFLAGRVGCKVQSGMCDSGRQIGIHDARLDNGALIFEVDFEDAIHAREKNDDAAVARERAAGKAGARAASDERGLTDLRFRRCEHARRRAGKRCNSGERLRQIRRTRRGAGLRDDGEQHHRQAETSGREGVPFSFVGRGEMRIARCWSV